VHFPGFPVFIKGKVRNESLSLKSPEFVFKLFKNDRSQKLSIAISRATGRTETEESNFTDHEIYSELQYPPATQTAMA